MLITDARARPQCASRASRRTRSLFSCVGPQPTPVVPVAVGFFSLPHIEMDTVMRSRRSLSVRSNCRVHIINYPVWGIPLEGGVSGSAGIICSRLHSMYVRVRWCLCISSHDLNELCGLVPLVEKSPGCDFEHVTITCRLVARLHTSSDDCWDIGTAKPKCVATTTIWTIAYVMAMQTNALWRQLIVSQSAEHAQSAQTNDVRFRTTCGAHRCLVAANGFVGRMGYSNDTAVSQCETMNDSEPNALSWSLAVGERFVSEKKVPIGLLFMFHKQTYRRLTHFDAAQN